RDAAHRRVDALPGLVGVKRVRYVNRRLPAELRYVIDRGIRGLVARDAVAALAHGDFLVSLLGVACGCSLLGECGGGQREACGEREGERQEAADWHCYRCDPKRPGDYNAILGKG